MGWLLDPLAFDFFARALWVGALVGAMCGAIGVFIVLRRMSYIGHGLAHSVLGGVAVALALDLGLYAGAAAATLVSAVLIDRISARRGLHADAAIGIVTTAMFALGVVVISATGAVRVSIESLLFGQILGISATDAAVTAGVAVVFAALLATSVKRLALVSFDPVVATAHGVRTAGVQLIFNVLVAAVVIVSVRVVGVTLIAAAIVVPAALTRLLTADLARMLIAAPVIGAVVAVAGLYASLHLDAPSGATIVLTGGLAFTVVAVAAATARWWGHRRPVRATDPHEVRADH